MTIEDIEQALHYSHLQINFLTSLINFNISDDEFKEYTTKINDVTKILKSEAITHNIKELFKWNSNNDYSEVWHGYNSIKYF